MKTSKVVQQWIRYARADLKVAIACLEQSSEFKNIATFHTQQCAEKIVKAYLTFRGVRVAKTHDLAMLIGEVAKVDSKLANKIKKSKSLTIYAVTYRYPDAERKPLTMAKAKASVKIAYEVFENCLEAIRK